MISTATPVVHNFPRWTAASFRLNARIFQTPFVRSLEHGAVRRRKIEDRSRATIRRAANSNDLNRGLRGSRSVGSAESPANCCYLQSGPQNAPAGQSCLTISNFCLARKTRSRVNGRSGSKGLFRLSRSPSTKPQPSKTPKRCICQ